LVGEVGIEGVHVGGGGMMRKKRKCKAVSTHPMKQKSLPSPAFMGHVESGGSLPLPSAASIY